MLNIDRIHHIKDVARVLFCDTQLISTPTGNQGAYSFAVQNEQLVEKIMSTLGDSGLLYIATWENMTELWADIRALDDYGLAQWLLQSASTFRVLGFESQDEYVKWIEQLSIGYCGHVESSGADVERSLALDDEYADRLPRMEEYRNLLRCNPWFVYLLSLQLSYHEIYRELIGSEYEISNIKR
jgi:hypothetical protein